MLFSFTHIALLCKSCFHLLIEYSTFSVSGKSIVYGGIGKYMGGCYMLLRQLLRYR